MSDQADRQQHHDALRESEARYRSLFQDSPISLWEEDFTEVKAFLDGLRTSGVTDLRAYLEAHPQAVAHCVGLVKVIGVNQASLDLFGAASESDLFRGLEQVLTGEARNVFREELIALAQGQRQFRSETVHRTLAGARVHGLLSLAVAPGYEETWAKVFVSAIDISEQKRAVEALQENELRYRALFERTSDAVFLLDLEGRHIVVNRRAADLLGYTQEEMIGMWARQVIAPDEYPDSQGRLAALRAGESLPVYGRTFLRKDGARVPVEINAALVYDPDGRPLHIQSVVRDISERKRAEAERERLLADLIHRSTQLVTAAEVSKAASTRLDPGELMAETVTLIGERFGFYYVGLFLVDEASEYTVLRAGTGQAGQAMLAAGHKLAVGGESMIGACVAHAEPRVALDVGEEAIRFDNPFLPETRSELALPLISRGVCLGALTVQSTQADAFSADDIAGLQSLADQLAIALSNARLYDEVQRYATHLEELVAARTSELAAVNSELASLPNRCAGWGCIGWSSTRALQGYGELSVSMGIPLRVLIVEDSEDDALLVVRQLRRSDYEPSFARVDTPATLQAALAQQSWDVVIADFSMPRFDGLQALQLVRKSGFDLPFILVSGTIGEDAAVAAMKAGVHDYLDNVRFERACVVRRPARRSIAGLKAQARFSGLKKRLDAGEGASAPFGFEPGGLSPYASSEGCC